MTGGQQLNVPPPLTGDELVSATRLAVALAGQLATEPETVVLRHALGPWASARMHTVQTPDGRLRCGHLRARPAQPIVVPAPSILVCVDCFAARRDGELFLSCPGCERSTADAGPLRPVVVQEGVHVLRGMLCARCVTIEQDQFPR